MTDYSGFSRLYAAEHGRLSRILRRITGSADVAEDIVHDAFVKLSSRQIAPSDIGLLVRTAQNLARDMRRAERVRTAYAVGVTSDQGYVGEALPDEAMAARQELADLFEALKSLPERTQRIFLLSKIDELSYPQIAAKLDVSVSTVEKDMVVALEFCRTWRRRRDLF
jgi:RNA polymerase sigma-70 factor (ECF subfamily)